MHTTSTDKTVFHHNYDFDGDVIINSRDNSDISVRVPFEDLVTLVACARRQWLTEKLDSLSDEEIFNIKL